MPDTDNTQTPKASSFSLVHVEQPGHNIAAVAFNGTNYDEWARFFRLALMAKGKLGYIDGTISKPAVGSDKLQSWTETNALVTSWILISVEPTVRKQISIRPEAKLVWTDIKNRFSQENDTRIYQLEAELLACRQGPTETLMSYYGRITTIWNAIMEHDPLPSCSCDPCSCEWFTLMNARREKTRVRGFLLGLDERFANVRSQIIGISPLPSLDIIYNRLLQDEGVRNISTTKTDPIPEPMAFATRIQNNSRLTSGAGGRDGRPDRRTSSEPSKYFCIACQRSGHSLKFCYRVTGKYPDSWTGPRDRIYLDPNATDLTNAVFVPDPRSKNASDRGKQSTPGHGPKANMAMGGNSSRQLTQFDKLDLNSLSPNELEELSTLWQAHKADTSDTRLHGPYLEDGDWCG